MRQPSALRRISRRQPRARNTSTLQDDGVKSFADVKQGTSYVVDENVIPLGWDLQNIDRNVAGRLSLA